MTITNTDIAKMTNEEFNVYSILQNIQDEENIKGDAVLLVYIIGGTPCGVLISVKDAKEVKIGCLLNVNTYTITEKEIIKFINRTLLKNKI